mmetsp:Transcript_115080/g.245863  ORF Transcript_115080/g.245863 Transcript_115080/m.245863 type:complete len:255 (-) Transcript_115080:1510-2274(-)
MQLLHICRRVRIHLPQRIILLGSARLHHDLERRHLDVVGQDRGIANDVGIEAAACIRDQGLVARELRLHGYHGLPQKTVEMPVCVATLPTDCRRDVLDQTCHEAHELGVDGIAGAGHQYPVQAPNGDVDGVPNDEVGFAVEGGQQLHNSVCSELAGLRQGEGIQHETGTVSGRQKALLHCRGQAALHLRSVEHTHRNMLASVDLDKIIGRLDCDRDLHRFVTHEHHVRGASTADANDGDLPGLLLLWLDFGAVR